MDAETLRTITIVCLLVLVSLWILSSFLIRVSGDWLRTDEPVDKERVTFTQFGPYVQGQAILDGGGKREYSGFLLGRTLRLSRRDYGVNALERQGFPREIAPLLEGKINAKIKFKVGASTLEGRFFPQKISYTLQPPRITGVSILPSKKRVYARQNPASRALPKA